VLLFWVVEDDGEDGLVREVVVVRGGQLGFADYEFGFGCWGSWFM
jgi:hypothetical protein